jgi:hypothetical protein
MLYVAVVAASRPTRVGAALWLAPDCKCSLRAMWHLTAQVKCDTIGTDSIVEEIDGTACVPFPQHGNVQRQGHVPWPFGVGEDISLSRHLRSVGPPWREAFFDPPPALLRRQQPAFRRRQGVAKMSDPFM